MADIFSTNVLAKVVENLNRPSSFLLDTYFPQVVVSDTEEINFDVLTRARRLDRRVQRQDIGLKRDVVDQADDLAHLGGALIDRRHRLDHLFNRLASGLGQPGRLAALLIRPLGACRGIRYR